MKLGRTLGFIIVFIGGLLVTTASIYANHFVAGGGRYSLMSKESETSVQFQFLGVASSPNVTDRFIPVIQTTIKCTVTHKGRDISFQLSTSGTELDPFMVSRRNPRKEFPRSVTLTGNMLSKLVVGAGPERQQFTEIARFEALGVDAAIPGADKDTFTLTLYYNASQDTGPLLAKALGDALVTCDNATCTLTVTGTLADGEIEGHTASGE